MGIGTSAGQYFPDEKAWAMDPHMPPEADKEMEKKPTETNDKNVYTPDDMRTNQKLDDAEQNQYGPGIPIGWKTTTGVDITDEDVDKGIDIATAFSGGGLSVRRGAQVRNPANDNVKDLVNPNMSKVDQLAKKLGEAENGPGSWDRIGGGGQEHYYRDARKALRNDPSANDVPGAYNPREPNMIGSKAQDDAMSEAWSRLGKAQEIGKQIDELNKKYPHSEFDKARLKKLEQDRNDWFQHLDLGSWFGGSAQAKPTESISGEKNAPYPSFPNTNTPALGVDTGNESFIEGNQGRAFRTPFQAGMTDKQVMARISEDATPSEKERVASDFGRAEIAKHRSAVATLGYDPNKVVLERKLLTVGGMYDKNTDKMMYLPNLPDNASALIHESVHRGFNEIRKNSEEGKKLLEDSGIPEELFVRYMMATKMGDPENNPDHPVSIEQRDQAMKVFKRYPQLKKDLDKLEDIAANLVKEKRPRGPR